MFSIPVVPAAVGQNSFTPPSFAQHFLSQKNKIEEWFKENWLHCPPPFYASMDLRYAGFKLAPVDTNLFPAGFNNLHSAADPFAIHAIQTTLRTAYPSVKRIILIPENHTRNIYYFENIAKQLQLLNAAGYEVRLGSLRPDLFEPESISLPSSQVLTLEPITRKADQLYAHTFLPELILLNNDLSEGIPDILLNLTQTVLPMPQLGWSKRKKSRHFYFYEQVVERFASLLAIDPWLISAYFDTANELNFLTHQGDEMIADKAAALLARIQEKYTAYQIAAKPYLIIKADAGTYGMGIIRITDPNELRHLNRKQRTKMSVSKGHQAIEGVLLQEGVRTIELSSNAMTAESVLYTIGQFVVGGFYRMHEKRAEEGILNAPGMSFESFPLLTALNDQFYIYSVVARLALLAAAYETQEVKSP